MTLKKNSNKQSLEPTALVDAKRLEEMKSVMSLISRWMEAIYRLPLLENPIAFYREKERIAALLVDNHLGKLARKIRLLDEKKGLDSGSFLGDWAEIAFFTSLWRGYDCLPEGLQLNLIYQSGPNITKKHLSEVEAIIDQFVVVGKGFVEEEQLLSRSVYVYARLQKEYYILLDYSFNLAPFDQIYQEGEIYDGSVVRYPFSGSMRIRPLNWKRVGSIKTLFQGMVSQSMKESVRLYGEKLKLNPFCNPWPLMIEMITTYEDSRWIVRDTNGDRIILNNKEIHQYASFYSATYDRTVLIVALFTPSGVLPLSYYNGQDLIPFEYEGKLPDALDRQTML